MSKQIKILIGVFAVFAAIVLFIVVSFNMAMKPDKEKEVKAWNQADQYLKENFGSQFVLYDTLFDNLGNFEFEYAAKVLDEESKTEFLVYYDEETDQMVDTYTVDRWENDIEKEIGPHLNGEFAELKDLFVFMDSDDVKGLEIDPNNHDSYKDHQISPTVRITIPRKKQEADEELFNEFITFLQNDDVMEHGTIIVAYIAGNGVILEDNEWVKEF
ncbi:hypothetical protein [Cytobacillus purgationiresistens]|uniref:Uncharacterized protein n=1 Tax=Cytobacillus purgationiresistens TaxID=863449 RepID=A0ABU0AND8_9BACI|nr:hypothetical protein [Cytobacillus purgationiresistens]MDQ0272802.1 hypothetical protein [Cytobacillus purgationiresistens]